MFSLFCMTLIQPIYGTEVDSFTTREEVTLDSINPLNAEMNRRLQKAVRRANTMGKCSEGWLYFHLGMQLRAGLTGGFMISPLESFANKNKAIQAKSYPRKNSIYRQVGFLQSIPITVYPLGKLLLVNGHHISGDKFSHFLNVGWSYHKKIEFNGKPVEATLKWGQKTERGIWGLATSGVYSYADLVANYDGFRFWSTLFGGRDPDGNFIQPTFACIEDEWRQVREFTWEEWITAGWDEAINCNFYAKRLHISSDDRVDSKPDSVVLTCPIDTRKCNELHTQYPAFGSYMISTCN